MQESSGATGLVVVTLIDADGRIKSQQTVRNLITDAGDQYHVKRIAAGVVPLASADVTKVTGMKLGTATTAASKSGSGAALGTYVAGSAVVFDTGFPTTENLGGGLGWTVTYQCTFGAGIGTSAALTEVALVTDAAADATSVAANTVARVVFAATPKAAADTLAVGWAHKQLGS
jgi:hypothetical protein